MPASKKKGGLGKGISALLADAAAESGSNSIIEEIPVEKICPNPNQPRTEFDDEGIDELAASIEKQGLLQPIVVRPLGDKYEIIAGERRWQACKKLGKEAIPATVLQVDSSKSFELALIENLQRINLNPVEEARGYKELIAVTGMSQTQVAEAVSKSRVYITNALRLLELPEPVLTYLYQGSITSGHARAILSVPDDEKRQRLAEKVVNEKLSVRETESIARLLAAPGGDFPKRPEVPRAYKAVARLLKQQFGTNVRIKNTRGKNKIEIEFKDEADLERIYRMINSDNDVPGGEEEDGR